MSAKTTTTTTVVFTPIYVLLCIFFFCPVFLLEFFVIFTYFKTYVCLRNIRCIYLYAFISTIINRVVQYPTVPTANYFWDFIILNVLAATVVEVFHQSTQDCETYSYLYSNIYKGCIHVKIMFEKYFKYVFEYNRRVHQILNGFWFMADN